MSDPVLLPAREIPAAPTEAEALLTVLHRNRRTFGWKVSGLDADGMRRTLAPSSMTLGGLVKHLALVEDHYFTHQLLGQGYPDVWAPMATSQDSDWEWTSAAQDTPEQLLELWRAAVARSEVAVERVLADSGLEQRVAVTDGGGEPHTLRRVLVDLIEEYARHTGQADLIRESVDGLVGEDAPR